MDFKELLSAAPPWDRVWRIDGRDYIVGPGITIESQLGLGAVGCPLPKLAESFKAQWARTERVLGSIPDWVRLSPDIDDFSADYIFYDCESSGAVWVGIGHGMVVRRNEVEGLIEGGGRAEIEVFNAWRGCKPRYLDGATRIRGEGWRGFIRVFEESAVAV